jgi:ferrous iron transport protein B
MNKNITLIGNPNSGKTTLFNLLTGTNQKTGNWPGVTVDKKQGVCYFEAEAFNVIDLPGIYSIDNFKDSIDAQISKNYVLDNKEDIYLNILDASTLERGLYLTNQLREQGVDVIVILNMMDITHKLGIEIDIKLLEKKLSVKVLSFSFTHDKNTSIIFEAINSFKKQNKFEVQSTDNKNEAEELLSAVSYSQQAKEIVSAVVTEKKLGFNLSDKVDKWVLGRWTGIPIFLIAMYFLFLFSINFGGAFIDFFDISTGVIFVDGFAYLLNAMNVPEILVVILADGVGGGIQVVATFIPIIAFLYLFLTLLEEIGYLARAAFVMNKFMSYLGISGKAFIPLIIGFGCNVPGIMAARTLDSHKQRITTVLMSPFMSCGARLAVYALFAAAFFPIGGQNIVFLLYLVGIFFAILTAFIMKKALKGEDSEFLIELPTYHTPSLRNILTNTWNKLKGFIMSAGKIIIVIVALINITNSIGVDGSFGHQDTDKSILSMAAKSITPIFAPMGLKEENWPATVGILTGLLAKEVVVGTLDSLYSNIAKEENNQSEVEDEFNFVAGLFEAVKSIPVNISDALTNLSDPLGLGVLEEAKDKGDFAQSQDVSVSTFGVMVSYFDGKIGAFAYLLFILLYFPCVAATGAMLREVGRNWAITGVVWSTGLGYIVAVVFYQAATFSQHYLSSTLWIVGLLSLLLGTVLQFIKRMRKIEKMNIPVIMAESNCSHCP